MSKLPDEQIVVQGAARTIAYAVDASGSMPARDFLESGSKGKRSPTPQELAGLKRLFELMAEKGSISNTEQFHKVRDKIFGFKKYQARVAAFQDGDVWYLTHGFKKKKDKWQESEIDRAKRIQEQHLQRTKG